MSGIYQSLKIFTIILGMCSLIFTAFSQSLDFTPKDTTLVSQKQEKQAEGKITITTYKFYSHSSKDKIVEFYDQMFSNEGYKRSKQSTEKAKAFLKGNSVVLMNFVPDYKDESAIYYNIQVQEFPAGSNVEE